MEQLEVAVADPAVSAIVLDIDSPGGFVNGTVELADAVRLACLIKPVIAVVRGMCCSGAYWIATQCVKIISRPESQVGNIGVYSVLVDFSKFYESLGITMTTVASGQWKGLGADGKVTDDLITDTKRINSALFSQFVAAVADGRDLDAQQAMDLADGRAFLGPQAKQLNLVDELASSFDAAIIAATGDTTPDGESAMAKTAITTAVVTRTPPATQTAATTAAPPVPNQPAASKSDDGGSDSNESARKVLTATIESAKSHRSQVRAAMDHCADMGEADDETKKSAKSAISSLKATSDEATRCAKAWLSKAGGDEDDEDDDDDKEGGDGEDENKSAANGKAPIAQTSADYISAFGDAGARWFVQGKPFAAAASEYITQLKAEHKTQLDALKAENADLQKRLGAVDRGNEEARASLPTDAKSGTSTAVQMQGLRPGLAAFASSIKLPAAK
jgi:signal peptide peptidase SppA